MAIDRVDARWVSLPVERPTRMSTRNLDRRDYLLVEVEADGVIGHGYSYAGTRGGSLLAIAVRDLLADVLLGASENDIAALWERMYQESLLVGRRGAVVRAISAVDIALWDLQGVRNGVPLAVLLGGDVKAVPAYASGGYYRPDEGAWTDAVAREIEFNRSLGFEDHKIKVGGLSVAEDAARVAAATEAIAGRGRLALDANNAYRSVAEAVAATRAFERAAGAHGIWWIEEPLSPDDVAGHAQIARELETIVATGEIHQTRWEFRDLIAAGAADLLQPDVGVLGGITEWMRVARTAETFGLQVAPHWHANVHAHLAAATPNCPVIEHFAMEKDIYNFERLLTPESRLEVGDGCVLLSDRPGIGLTFDREVVDRFTRVV
ncbi:MAG TPA: mandelate racemase/muconate lactonizing enzyme family protein [Jatrophihabitans sp.]|nr:mandelate racemase/muconate lactonizing enzyme family protein [Jatrophihabitans sp.]